MNLEVKFTLIIIKLNYEVNYTIKIHIGAKYV